MKTLSIWYLLAFIPFSISAQNQGCISGNCKNGFGTFLYPDGSKYTGHWKNNQKGGSGTLYYKSGAIYEGDWEIDQKHGKGTYTWPNGNQYSGNFAYDEITGEGIKYQKNGVYKGYFLNGRRHGQGTYTWKNGTRYQGEWLNDQRTGMGTVYYSDGTFKKGKWINGHFVEENGDEEPLPDHSDSLIAQNQIENEKQRTLPVSKPDKNRKDPPKKEKEKKAVVQPIIKPDPGPSEIAKPEPDKPQTPETKTSKPNASPIRWLTPENYKTVSQESKKKIMVCIDSKGDIGNIEIQVNSELQYDPSNRGFQIVSGVKCSLPIEKIVTLSRGENIIKVIMEYQGGKATSEERIIHYTPPAENPHANENRTALIIGNGDYRSGPLRNPVNDATQMANALKILDFDVILLTNASQMSLKKAIKDFGERIAQQRGVGLFYFAGHGMQVNGSNFLIPVGSEIKREIDVELESVDLNRVLSEMDNADNRLNVVILDACRDNPFEQQFRTTSGAGLTIPQAPLGTFIAFATAPGEVAADGAGNNGLFTQELLDAVTIPGLKIEEVFKRVRTQVRIKSGGLQIPWEKSSIEGDFYFNFGQ